MEDILIPLAAILALFIGMPWLFLHYRLKSRQNRSLSIEDERMLDDLHQTALRLDDRIQTIERIMSADNPGWRQIAAGGSHEDRLEDRHPGARSADIRSLK